MKKILSFLLILSFVASLYSCSVSENAPTQTKTEEKASQESVGQTDRTQNEDDDAPIQNGDLLDQISLWQAAGDAGVIDQPSSHRITFLETAEDFAPWKNLIEVRQEDLQAALDDRGGVVLMLEISASQEKTLYHFVGIYQDAGTITLHVNEEAVEEKTPRYTQFLIYIPNSCYDGEQIRAVMN